MTTEEMWFSLFATAVGSPLILEMFRSLNNWRRGRISKTAALEAALAEAEGELEGLHEQHRTEVDELHRQRRELELEAHRLRVRLIQMGIDYDEQE